MSSVARASPMKRAILAATPPICAVRSGVDIKGLSPICWRNITSKSPPAADIDSIAIQIAYVGELDFFSLSFAQIECRRISGRPRAGFQTAPDELPPSVLRVISIGKQFEIGAIDHSFVGKRLEVYDASPIRSINKDDRNGRHLLGLNEREQFKQFIECTETTRKSHQRVVPHREMELAYSERLN